MGHSQRRYVGVTLCCEPAVRAAAPLRDPSRGKAVAPVRVRSYLTSPAATTRRGRRRSQGWSGCAPTAHHERATGVLKGSPSRRGCGRKTCRTVLVRSSPRRHGSFPNRPPRATRATAPGPARTGDGGRADARAEDFGGGYGPSDEGRVSTETRHEGAPPAELPTSPLELGWRSGVKVLPDHRQPTSPLQHAPRPSARPVAGPGAKGRSGHGPRAQPKTAGL